MVKPEDKNKKPRRKTNKISIATWALSGVLVGAKSCQLDTQAYCNEQISHEMAEEPTRMLVPMETDLIATLKQLKAEGYNMFCLGDGNHGSAATPETVDKIVMSDIGITDHFQEYPEKGKENEALDQAVATMSYAKNPPVINLDPNAVSENPHLVTQHRADSHIGPDAKNSEIFFHANGEGGLKKWVSASRISFDGRNILSGFERDIVFRNQNMSRVIADTFKSKQGDICCIFPVGIRHLMQKDNVVELLKAMNIPTMKPAIIELQPVNSAELNGKVWKCSNMPDHFVVTVHDEKLGAVVTDKGFTLTNFGEGLQYHFLGPRKFTERTSTSNPPSLTR